jgi:lysophospholipase L1-like esterase
LPSAAALLLAASMSASAPPAASSYLALGDSYTIGESVAQEGRWPEQLAAALRREGIVLAAPRVIAATGWTTDELAQAMDAAEPLGRWDFVSLLIGVNNQYRRRGSEEFRRELRGLLARARGLAGGRASRLLVLTIPDWGVTPFGAASGRDRTRIGAELDAYNAVVREEAQRIGARCVDIAPVSRARGGEPAMVAPDGLHPSAALYAEWTALALPVAREALRAGAAPP